MSTPASTRSFLFTDIEGSTRRWEHQRTSMAAALVRHDALLRAAIETHGGTVFKTVGDAFCAVFEDPSDALAAAVSAQRVLLAEEWSTFGADFAALRVRIGIHTGEPDERGGDYFGPDVNRVARLMACGHGGQILVSESTVERVRACLPAGVTLRDMGERRLKDLSRPERVFQVVAADLPTEFLPLATLDARPNNLPIQLTSLVGRESEVTHLVRLLRADTGPRLATLVGAGGTGKTRLALQVAADLIDDFDHGVWFVDLAPLENPELVIPTIAHALAVDDVPGQTVAVTLRDWLSSRNLLLLLDNFERLLPAAVQVAGLIAAAPRLKLLVTSRERLRIRGERVVALEPLPVPRADELADTNAVAGYPAVQLFSDRAADVRNGFRITTANASVVGEICARLDGLPLAIELAAARIASFEPEDMLQRIASRLKLLRDGYRDLPERQRAIRSAIAWSVDLLDAPEQALFRRLSVFAGGATLASAEAVCDVHGELGIEAADGLASLVEKSLVRQTHAADDSTRYGMLETVREYASEALTALGEEEDIRGRHAAWFANLVEVANEQAPRTSDPQPWLDSVEQEIDNLRAVLAWCLDRAGQEETAYAIAVTVGGVLSGRPGGRAESQYWGARALALVDRTGSRSPGAAAVVAGWGGDERFPEAMERYESLGDWAAVAGMLNVQGLAAMDRGELDRAEACFLRFLDLQREYGLRQAEKALGLLNLGEVAQLKGDLDLAEQRYVECLEVGRGWLWPSATAEALKDLGCLAWARGDTASAVDTLREALCMVHEFRRDLFMVAKCLAILASMAAVSDEPEAAVPILGASDAILRSIDPLAKPLDLAFDPIANALCAQGLAAVAAALSPEVRERRWAEGAALGPGEAVGRALALGVTAAFAPRADADG